MISSYTSWQPLEEVIVGDCFSGDYFDIIEDKKVYSQLAQILDETKEDFNNLAKLIEEYGASVKRPYLQNKTVYQNDWQKFGEPDYPPLTPRDVQITLGEKLLVTSPEHEYQNLQDEYAKTGQVIDPFGQEWSEDNIMSGANASCIVRIGTDVFVDESEWLTRKQSKWIEENVLDDRYKLHVKKTDGHGDSVFAILKPGVILSTYHADDLNLEEEFRGWDILKILDPTIIQAEKIGEFRSENFNGRWYVPEETPSKQFANFVDTYLTKWTGNASETVFTVNCLVLDEQNVIFSGYNKEVFDFCKKHKIEPIISPIRHKFFWDTGISCSTQDIRRKGGLESYL